MALYSPFLLEAVRAVLAPFGRGVPARVYRALGGHEDPRWKGHPRPARRFREVGPEGLHFTADLSDWLERRHYFSGYPDRAGVALLRCWLRRGDSMVDVGANRGAMALRAGRLVGPEGRVVAFEPHPRTFRRLLEHREANALRNVTIHQMALGESAGELILWAAEEHHGIFSLRPQEDAAASIRHTVSVQRGDAILTPDTLPGRCLVKIDVEGFELAVLAGLGWLRERPNTVWYVEVTDEWLQRSGGSAKALVQSFRDRGFAAALPWWRGGRLVLEPFEDLPALPQFDAVFHRPGEGLTG